MRNPALTQDLDKLIRRTAAVVKTAAVKTAADPTTGLDNGTKPASTGEQAAANKAANKDYTAAANDNAAKASVEGQSVEKSTDGASASATDGSEGAKGAESPEKAPGSKTAAALELAATLRKTAATIETEIAARNAKLDGFEKFIVKAARANPDANIKLAAEQAEDADVAGAGIDNLLQQIQSGQLTDEQAEQILQEALQAGAITQEELQQAMQELQGAQVGAEGGAVPPEAEAEAQQKMAAAKVGPDHADYAKKLEAMYAADVEAGRELARKTAAYIEKEHEKAEVAKKTAAGAVAAKAKAHEAGETKAEEIAEHKKTAAAKLAAEFGLTAEQVDAVLAAPAPEIKTAAEKVEHELRAEFVTKLAGLKP